jgi:hypothetical protein
MAKADISPGAGRDRIRDALTELYAYTLVLDGELQRTETLVGDLNRPRSDAEALRRRRSDIAVQLELLRRTILALRTAADPAGRYL